MTRQLRRAVLTPGVALVVLGSVVVALMALERPWEALVVAGAVSGVALSGST